MILTAKQLKQLKKILAKYKVEFAYFFGSRAYADHVIESSDYDFAVCFGSGNEQSRFKKRLLLHHEMQVILTPSVVDIVVLDDVKSISLRNEIIASGQLIYDTHPEQRFDYELRTMQEYDDFMPFLEAYNRAYIAAV